MPYRDNPGRTAADPTSDRLWEEIPEDAQRFREDMSETVGWDDFRSVVEMEDAGMLEETGRVRRFVR